MQDLLNLAYALEKCIAANPRFSDENHQIYQEINQLILTLQGQ